MGIYCNEKIFGIKMYKFTEDDISDTLYEIKYDKIMCSDKIKEAYLFYSNLNEKTNICFKIYTECSCTLNANIDNFMIWKPVSLNTFLKAFEMKKE